MSNSDMPQQNHKEEPRQDAFGDEEHAQVKYKVLKWWYDMSPPG